MRLVDGSSQPNLVICEHRRTLKGISKSTRQYNQYCDHMGYNIRSSNWSDSKPQKAEMHPRDFLQFCEKVFGRNRAAARSKDKKTHAGIDKFLTEVVRRCSVCKNCVFAHIKHIRKSQSKSWRWLWKEYNRKFLKRCNSNQGKLAMNRKKMGKALDFIQSQLSFKTG